MAGDKPEAIVRKYYAKAVEGDSKAIDELLSEDFVLHTPMSDEPIRGCDEFKRMMAEFRAGTPDMKFDVEDVRVDGESVVARWSAHVKHAGEFGGRPPSGKEADVTGADTIRIVNGKIVEVRNTIDLDAAERQFGFTVPKISN